MYMDYQNVPAESGSPTVPPPNRALSVVAAAPVPPHLKKEIRARRGRSTIIFTVLVALLVAAMLFNGIYSMPDGSFSKDSLWSMLLALGIVGIWKGAIALIEGKTPHPVSYDTMRINEIYEQGVMATGPLDRVVIPFDEVTSFVETAQWAALYSKEGEIVWLASDLTPAEAQNLFSVLAAHLPSNVFIRKAPLIPQKPFDTALPTIPFDPPVDTLAARWSVKEAVTRAYAAMLKRGAPLFFLMSMVLANVLCDSIGILDVEGISRFLIQHAPSPEEIVSPSVALAARFILMAAGALVCAGLSWLLVAWEQTNATNAANKKDVRLLILEDGVRVQNGANFTVIPQEGLHCRRDKNGTLCILLGNRVLTVDYPEYSRSMAARNIFNL